MTEKDLARFWSKVFQGGGPDACWPWVAFCEPKYGYGRFRLNGQQLPAHRVALWASAGPPDDVDMLATHSCRTPSCCNPRHLSWGTHKTNLGRDRLRDGTTPRGTRNGRNKLSAAQVIAILREYEEGREFTEIAKNFGVARSTVCMITSGRSWAWMTGRKIEDQRKYARKT